MKKRINKIRWEIAKIFRFDNVYSLSISFKCNSKCDYCLVKVYDVTKYQEHDYKWWIDFIDRNKFKIVSISGGEPSIFPGIEHIINHCIDRKILVNVSTNLRVLIKNIKKSWRLRFCATYHDGFVDLRTFLINYTKLSKDYWVSVQELHNDETHVIPFARDEKIFINEWGDSLCPHINYFPNGEIIPKRMLIPRHNEFIDKVFKFLRDISGYTKKMKWL